MVDRICENQLGNDWPIAFIILCLVSMIFSLIIPTMYYFRPKTRKDVQILIVMICLVECALIYHYLLVIFLFCYFERDGGGFFLERELAWIMDQLHFHQILESQFEELNHTWQIILMIIQQLLYIGWCANLVLIIRKPFLSKIKINLIIFLPIAVVFISIQIVTGVKAILYQVQDYQMFLVHSYQTLYYFFYSVSSLTLIYCILERFKSQQLQNNLIRTVKVKYFTQQAIFLFILMLLWSFSIYDAEYILRDYLETQFQNFIFISQGVLLGIIRLQERYFRTQLFQFNDVPYVPISAMLEHVQSQQVMSYILDGIVKSMKSFSNNLESGNNQYQITSILVVQSKDLKRARRISLSQCEDLQESLITQNQNQQFKMKVTEYAPAVFAHLRGIDQMDVIQIEDSLSVQNNLSSIEQISESMGKSGSIFFKSYNKKLIIKTLKKSELDFLIKILYKYFSYIKENDQSLLARIYGCFTIEIEGVSPVYLILMENTFQKINEPCQSYDLKGSLKGRISNDINFGKDIDFLLQEEIFLIIQQKTSQLLRNQVVKDSEFLSDLNIMDYSLLMGVGEHQQSNDLKELGLTPKLRSVSDQFNGKNYSFGIIDYLQEFNYYKQVENSYLSLFDQESLISSVQPLLYSQRFIAFLNQFICSSNQY